MTEAVVRFLVVSCGRALALHITLASSTSFAAGIFERGVVDSSSVIGAPPPKSILGVFEISFQGIGGILSSCVEVGYHVDLLKFYAAKQYILFFRIMRNVVH